MTFVAHADVFATITADMESVDAAGATAAITQGDGDSDDLGFYRFVFSIKPKWRHEPLTREQDIALVRQATHGCRRSQNEVVARILPFLEACADALRRQHPHVCHDDLMSAGQLGIIEAMDRFDEHATTRFTTFARYAIAGQMRYAAHTAQGGLKGLRTKKERPRVLPLNGEAHAIHASEAMRQDPRVVAVLNAAYVQARQHATPRQDDYLATIGTPEGRDRTLESIGHVLSVSKERVRQLQTRAYALMREALAQQGVHGLADAI